MNQDTKNIAWKTTVQKWQQDREFVANYERGDIPEIIINRVTIGSRK